MPLTVSELEADIDAGRVEEVIVALPDLQGRLQGSRLGARHFLDRVLGSGFGACTYLLAVDVDMQTGQGWALDAEGDGYGDLTLVPDIRTLRVLPWCDATACVIGDPVDHAGRRIAVAPRTVLQTQLDRLAARGLHARAGTELEFLAFRSTYREAAHLRWRDLEPLTTHNSDYQLTGLGELEELARGIRRAMATLGLEVESARGECHPGQYEIVFAHAEALTACDEHVLYKAGAKEVAEREGRSLTFMPKYDAGEGNSCHVHLSLRDPDDRPAFAGDGPGGRSALMDAFLAGQLACMADFTLLFAPTVNAYKRLAPGAFAPSAVAWGVDNRRCAVRVVGSGASLRFEHRVGGGDVNPYLAVAAIVAAGLHGVEHGLALPAPTAGSPPASAPRLPTTLGEARERWLRSAAARAAFGDDVVEHLARAAQAELDAFARTVTDWERERGFARL